MAYMNPYQPYYNPQYQSQSQMQPTQMSVTQPQPQQNNSIIWVQGEAGAKSYLVAPNTTVQLWDSESQVIYLKSADSSGMPSIKILDYTIREQAAQPQSILQTDEFAKAEDIKDLRKQIDALNKKIKALTKEDKSNE